MKRKNIKQEKGITLIALVITIIVLLILAGVAISMLSGENGILTRASEAKEKTEEAQKNETIGLATMELEAQFIINNSKYKCKDGLITGFSTTKNATDETVEVFEKSLPTNYKVSWKYDKDTKEDIEIKEEEKVDMHITTGMAITKDGQEVGRTVVFGDINCDGNITGADSLIIVSYVGEIKEREKFIVAAMDVNHDGYIVGGNDKTLENGDIVKSDSICTSDATNVDEKIKQDEYVSSYNSLKVLGIRIVMQEFLESLPQEFKNSNFKFEVDYNTGACRLNGVTSTTKVKDVLGVLTGINARIYKPKVTFTEDDEIPSGVSLIITIEKKYDVSELSFGINY